MKVTHRLLSYIVILNCLVSCVSTHPEHSLHQESDRTLVRAKPVAEAQVPKLQPLSTTTSNNKHALLIGVGKYQPPDDLEGPPYDVEALKQALTSHWAFQSKNIATLTDSQATKKNILEGINNLLQQTQPGDEVFIFFSGHGTSASDEGFGKVVNLPHTSGAIVPFDFDNANARESLIVGKTDLQPLLTQFDQGERHVLVVFDACYSGNTVRSMYLGGKAKTKARYMKLPSSGNADNNLIKIFNISKSMSPSEPYPYRNIFYMSAAQENETASDVPDGNNTFDGKPHGAFTDALLRILNNQIRVDLNTDGNISFQEIYETTKNLVTQHWPQTPMALPINGNSNASSVASFSLFQIRDDSSSLNKPSFVDSEADKSLRISTLTLNNNERTALSSVDGVKTDDKNPDILFVKKTNGRISAITGYGDLITNDLPGQSSQQLTAWLQGRVWLARLLNLAKKKADFTATLEVGNGLGGTAVIEGERFNFTLQTERSAYLLLLSVNAQNQINILYPYNQQELLERNANQAIHFPGSALQDLIEATAPFGSDQVLLLAFDASAKRPAILDKLVGLQQLSVDSPQIQELYRALEAGQERYAASSLSLVSVSRSDTEKLIRQ